VGLPSKHTPSSLRINRKPERTQVMYACGYEHKPSQFGMWDGPNPDVMKMLETVPEKEELKPVIVEFKLDGSDEVIYRWDSENSCWVKT